MKVYESHDSKQWLSGRVKFKDSFGQLFYSFESNILHTWIIEKEAMILADKLHDLLEQATICQVSSLALKSKRLRVIDKLESLISVTLNFRNSFFSFYNFFHIDLVIISKNIAGQNNSF